MTSSTTVRLLHEGWVFREQDAAAIPNSDVRSWLPAEVPGHVHLDLERAGVIPDPFERMHERGVQWVDERGWTYRTRFEVHGAELDGARHVLRFDGLDTFATVVLNGAEVGRFENMFVPHELDVTDALRRGSNDLEVRFEPAERVGAGRREAALPALDETVATSRGFTSRSTVRKAQYMWGWDWGPCLRGCGIWQPVSLVRIPVGRLCDWSWRTAFEADGSCALTVRAEAEGSATTVRVTVDGQEVSGAVGSDLVVRIADPERWWPAGYGAAHLYDLRLELLAEGAVVDHLDHRVGLREVELVQEPDVAGSSFGFRVNGVAVYAKGANWIPDDSFPARIDAGKVRTQLEMAVECGMNMLRIWGGGLYESTDFYDACDDLGLLVWQDFPFACGLYEEDGRFADAVTAEATAAVRRVRNHTSLALWCGNNESQWLYWMGAYGRAPVVLAQGQQSEPSGVPLLGARLYDEVLPAVVAAEDPGTPYWPGSPWGTEDDPSGEGTGDCHYWNVWHGEGDWVHYAKCTARFVSEFGFAGPPDLLTLEESLDPADLGVDTPGMRWHDKTNKGYDTYLGYIALHYPAPSTLPDLVYYGQLNQADAMRFGIEHFRRLRPHTMGTLVWQLNDCWPVQSWAWIDHRLRPKAAWYAAKRFYAPLLLSLWRDGDQLRAHLVNDAVEGREGTLDVRVVDHDGTVLWSSTTDAAVGPGGSVEGLAVDLPADVLAASAHAVVHATFADVESTLLLCEPKDLRLPVAQVQITATPEADGGARLRLSSTTLALSVVLSLQEADGRWSDNVLHLLPGEAREVTVTSPDGLTYEELVAAVRWRSL
jgi:beta-mannosidase